MATNIVQMTDGSGNKQYPVTSAEAVGMPDGSGNLQNYLNKRVTELNISVLYPTQGIGGTNKYDLAGAISQVEEKYHGIIGLKITFIDNVTEKPETWKYNGGTFTSKLSWSESVGVGDSVKFEEKVGAVMLGTGEINGNFPYYRYIDIDVSEIRKLKLKGKNTNGALGYAVFDSNGDFIRGEGGTYNLSTFSDMELTFSDEAKKLRFCYSFQGNTESQKITVLDTKLPSLVDKINQTSKQSFTLGSIVESISGKYINSSGILTDSGSFSIKYFPVKKGDKVQIENYTKGNFGNSPISFVLNDEILLYTNSNNNVNADNSTNYITAPQDCLCYITRYHTADDNATIINVVHSSIIDFVENIQENNESNFNLLKKYSAWENNGYNFVSGRRMNQGKVYASSGLYFCDENFYQAKQGDKLIFTDLYTDKSYTNDLLAIYSDTTEESYIKTLFTIPRTSDSLQTPFNVEVDIPQDCYYRLSTVSDTQTSVKMKVYQTQSIQKLVDKVNETLTEYENNFTDEKTIQVPLVSAVDNITKYYKCSDKCLIICDDFVYNNSRLRFHKIKDDPATIQDFTIGVRGHYEYTPPAEANYFSILITNYIESETGKVKLIVPSNFYYDKLDSGDVNTAKPLVISGDSVASNFGGKFVSTLINAETAILNEAAGSEGPWSTMMRIGWSPCMVFPFTIPASNEYGVNVDIINSIHYKPIINDDGTNDFTITDRMTQIDFLVSIWKTTEDGKPYIYFGGFDCEINGVQGKLGTSSGVIIDEEGNLVYPEEPTDRFTTIFQRKDAGDEVVINSPVLAKPLNAEIFANAYHINFMGQNLGFRDIDEDFYITEKSDAVDIDRGEVFFKMQKLCFNAAGGNYMIIGCLFKGYTNENFQPGFRERYERLCEKEFGGKFVNLRQYMLTQAHLACGRTLSQADKDMIKTGQLPPYLGDVHLNELGAEIAANLVAERCYELGWIKNKPNYYDVVATRIRLEGDGTITD